MEAHGETTQEDRHTANDRKHSIWCYMKKGWTAYVRSFRKYGEKYDGIKWDEEEKENQETVQDGAITKIIYKF